MAPLTYKEKKAAIKRARKNIAAAGLEAKILGHHPDAVEGALQAISRIITNIETRNELHKPK